MAPEIRTFTCDSFTMDYATFGGGPRALVILPGMSLSSVMNAAGAVANAFAQFAETHTVYLIERKNGIQPGYSVLDMADDTATMLKGLGIAGADVYGASQGAMIALAMTFNNPGLVHKLAVASTLAKQNPRSTATMAEWEKLALQGNPAALNHAVFSKVYSTEYYQKFEAAFHVLEKSGTPEELKRFAVLSAATARVDFYDRLTEIKCPVTVFGVEDDTVLGGQGSKEVAEKIGCSYHCYPGKGHAAYDEDPDFPGKLFAYFKD